MIDGITGNMGAQQMEQKWLKILGRMQRLEPGSVDAYVSDAMGIFIPRVPLTFADTEHVHRGYEFVIPFGPDAPYKVESKIVATEHCKIFPFNPEQPHQAVDETFNYNLLALFFSVDFMQSLAGSIYKTPEVSFCNRSYPYGALLQNLLQAFIEEAMYKQEGYDFITQSIATQVGIHILRGLADKRAIPDKQKHYPQKRSIILAMEFIHENYRQNFSLDEVARAAHLSPYHFSRIFKVEVGKTPFEYLLDVKIDRAKELLRRKDTSITEVCFECGFNNASHFTTTFSRRVGVTPSAYRKELAR